MTVSKSTVILPLSKNAIPKTPATPKYLYKPMYRKMEVAGLLGNPIGSKQGLITNANTAIENGIYSLYADTINEANCAPLAGYHFILMVFCSGAHYFQLAVPNGNKAQIYCRYRHATAEFIDREWKGIQYVV